LKAFLTAFAAILYMNPGTTSGKIENLLVVQAPAGFHTELDHLRAQLASSRRAAADPYSAISDVSPAAVIARSPAGL
jgi:hypothetical protein